MVAVDRYIAFLVTGILHILLGFVVFITGVVGVGKTVTNVYGVNNSPDYYPGQYSRSKSYKNIYVLNILCSLWIMFIGSLGISASLSKSKPKSSRGLTIAYMVTTILSACIFSVTGVVMYFLLQGYERKYYSIYSTGIVSMFLEFVLAIISSSICCCCSHINKPITEATQPQVMYPLQTVPVLQHQPTGMQAYTGVQYQPQVIQTVPGFQYQQPGIQNFSEVQNQPTSLPTYTESQALAQGFTPEVTMTKQ